LQPPTPQKVPFSQLPQNFVFPPRKFQISTYWPKQSELSYRHAPLLTTPTHISLHMSNFVNASDTGEIPSFNGDEKAKATDFANYFCSYAQLYHQKQMLADHNRMVAYHSAIIGNASAFKDKVVMDVGTGSGILAVWAAQAGARKVYASKLPERWQCTWTGADWYLVYMYY
jgi:hypothetical protein